MFSPPPRLNQDELLDEVGHDPETLRASLEQVAAVDRWLGGRRGVRRVLRDVIEVWTSEHPGSAFRILDVGTGNGRVLADITGWLEGLGLQVTAVGVDLHPEIVPLAGARARLHAVQGDGCRLPFADDSFDAVLTTLTLHHFDDTSALALLREMARVARFRVIVSDLERSRLHYIGARLLAETVWRSNPLTRHDGPISVLRSFTPKELAALGGEAGLRQVGVRRLHPFRLVMEGTP